MAMDTPDESLTINVYFYLTTYFKGSVTKWTSVQDSVELPGS